MYIRRTIFFSQKVRTELNKHLVVELPGGYPDLNTIREKLSKWWAAPTFPPEWAKTFSNQ